MGRGAPDVAGGGAGREQGGRRILPWWPSSLHGRLAVRHRAGRPAWALPPPGASGRLRQGISGAPLFGRGVRGGGVVANMPPLNQVHRCLRGRRRRGQRSAGFAIPCASGGHAARGALHLCERCPGRRRRAGQRLELAPHPCVLAGGSPFRLWAWAPPTPSGSSA